MASSAETLFAALKADLRVGPEHHRFRLKETPSPHPLGVLWQAEDLATTVATPVTLLFIQPALIAQPGFVDRLRDSLNRVRGKQHRYIANCHAYFVWRGLFFIAWAPLDGVTLAQMFTHGQARKLKNTQREGLIKQVAHGLETGLSQRHQPHATLCPEFIHINRGQGVLLTGFGWRDALEPALAAIVSPPSYHAWQSRYAFKSGTLDSHEDTFALASMIYQLYAGKPPFPNDGDASTRQEPTLKAPSGLSKQQWQLLEAVLKDEGDTLPGTPLALVRQLFDSSEEKKQEAPTELDTEPATEIEAEPAETVAATAAHRPRWRPGRTQLQVFSAFCAGLLLGLSISWLLRPASAPSTTQKLAESAAQPSTPAAPRSSPASGRREVAASTALIALPKQRAASHARPIVREKQHDTTPRAGHNITVFHDELGAGVFAPQMVVIPSGRFIMGDQHDRGDDNEKPAHEVTISKPFALSRYEVTFADYDRFTTATGHRKPDDEGWGRGNIPVVNVSWNDAQAYVLWLAKRTGQPYRLPTEAEWEYAARAGTQTQYWWGDTLKKGYADCDECGSKWDGRQPAPVGSFRPNPWGIYDLNGNVDEWVQDCYMDNYLGAPTDGSARGDGPCNNRVMRGGSWFDIGRLVRSASRYRHPPDSHRNNWGFRVALDLPDTSR